jgi:DNA-binding GntR family transcriptional regulator
MPAMRRPQLARRTLGPTVAARIEELLFTAQLKPGERINECHLAAELGVSRGPVREALRLLEKHGLVATQPNKGAYVSDFSDDEIAELYDIRATLEGLIGERAAPRIDAATLAALEADLAAMGDAADSTVYYRLNLGFHHRILAATSSPHLAGIYGGIARKLALRRIAQPAPTESLADSLREHHGIVSALATRDSRLAGEAMSAHCRASYHRFTAHQSAAQASA